MSAKPHNLLEAAVAVLEAGPPPAKCAAAQAALTLLQDKAAIGDFAAVTMPAHPARPEKPRLAAPADVPKRRLGAPQGKAALLHAIAHIEFNAIDLAFDMAARFTGEIDRLGLDAQAFITDWFGVGGDEARHFAMINQRLADFEVAYGDFPAHNGLWEAAENTSENLLARLAVAPMILEARGLDVTPGMIERLKRVGDEDSAAVLQVIYEEEIGHVACGNRWFSRVCKVRALEPAGTFHTLKDDYFRGVLKPPFNHKARKAAGLDRDFYERK